jgi:hypothetical protein
VRDHRRPSQPSAEPPLPRVKSIDLTRCQPLHQDSSRGGGVRRQVGSHMSWLPARLNMVNTPTA